MPSPPSIRAIGFRCSTCSVLARRRPWWRRSTAPGRSRPGLIAAPNGIRDFQTEAFGGGITCTPEDGRCNKNIVWIQKEPGGPIRIIGTTNVQ